MAAARGKARRALRLAGAAAAQYERTTTAWLGVAKEWVERYLAQARAAVAPEVEREEAAAACAMTLAQALALSTSRE